MTYPIMHTLTEENISVLKEIMKNLLVKKIFSFFEDPKGKCLYFVNSEDCHEQGIR